MQANKKRWNDFLYRPSKAAYLFIIPALFMFFVFVVIPLIASLFISFSNLNLFLTKFDFVGLKNYAKALSTARVLNSFVHSFYYMILEVPAQVAVGLIVAFLLQKNTLFNRLSRSLLYIPVVCSSVSIALIWSMLLDPNIGLVSYLFTLIGLPKLGFLKDVNMSMPTLAFMSIWKGFGTTMIIMLAGLTGISEDLYEAASIDGASKTQQFFRITIPMISPTINFCLVQGMIGALQMFDIAYVSTKGGPMQSTETAVMYLYNRAFNQPYELGFATAIAVLLAIIISIFSLTTNGLITRYERKIFDEEAA